MNVKLLRKVKKHILAEPKRFRMGIVHAAKGEEEFAQYRLKPKCGTVGCIAGWVCVLAKAKYFDSDTAQELLGLNEREADRLFFDTPEGFQKMWTDDGKQKTADLCAKRIDLFIKTEGRE